MGQLIFLHEINRDDAYTAPWFFKDAYFSGDSRSYRYAWPSPQYPARVCIHADDIINTDRIEIRKWVEKFSDSIVIHNQIDKSYRTYRTEECISDQYSDISNRWNAFYFEDEETATAFSLRFSNIIKPFTDTHPTRHWGFKRVY